MFENFAEYMFALLSTPFKRCKKSINQFWIFIKVIGKLFDEAQEAIYKTQRQMMILSCDDVLLDVYGDDYDLPRLNGESTENYRKRLIWKKKTAQLAGTKKGIEAVLESLGYGLSVIFPAKEIDPDAWAEFYILLKRQENTGINDLRILDAEVSKVKQASAKPRYIINAGNQVQIQSRCYNLQPEFPVCGILICNTWPKEGSENEIVE